MLNGCCLGCLLIQSLLDLMQLVRAGLLDLVASPRGLAGNVAEKAA